MATRKELKKFQALYHKNLSSIKPSEELKNILSKQRFPWVKTGPSYEEVSCSKQSECEPTMKTKGNEAITSVRNSDQNYQPRNVQKHSQQKKRPPRLRYQFFFYGYFIVSLILVTKLQTARLIF